MNEISLILLPNNLPDSLPPMLVQNKGVWRYMNPPDPGEPPITPPNLQAIVNNRLNNLMINEIDEATQVPWASLRGKCTLLYERVLPKDVKDMLQIAKQEAHPVLRIHAQRQHDWIPWEIMFDGMDFLGVKFQIARIPILTTQLELNDNQPHQVQSVRHALGQDVLDSTPGNLDVLWENTFSGIIPAAVQIARKPDQLQPVSWPTVDDLADNRTYDIVHITCHGNIINNDGEQVWALKLAGASEAIHYIDLGWMAQVKLQPSKSLVFGNACGHSGGLPQNSLSPMFGLDFFTRGALNYIGSFAPLSKSLALDFAHKFYAHLLQDNLPIGEALLETKKDYDSQAVITDPSYLFYCLYGSPSTRFQC